MGNSLLLRALIPLLLATTILPASGQSTPGLSIHCPDALDTEPNLTVTVRLPFERSPYVGTNAIAANIYDQKGGLMTGISIVGDYPGSPWGSDSSHPRGQGVWVSPSVFRLYFDIHFLKADTYTLRMRGTVNSYGISGDATCSIVKELRQTPIASLKLSKFTPTSFLLEHSGGDCLVLSRLDVEVDGGKPGVSSGLSSPSLCSRESTSVELGAPAIRKDSAVRIVYRPNGGEVAKAAATAVTGLPQFVCPDGSVVDAPEKCPRPTPSPSAATQSPASTPAPVVVSPTPAPRTPGFEAVLAVAAMVALVFLARRREFT